jgi:hypothetical protein
MHHLAVAQKNAHAKAKEGLTDFIPELLKVQQVNPASGSWTGLN